VSLVLISNRQSRALFTRYNFGVKPWTIAFGLLVCAGSIAQQKPPTHSEISPITVPINIDHNRVIVKVEVLLPDGGTESVQARVGGAGPDVYLSGWLAHLMKRTYVCKGQTCTGPAPTAIVIGGMTISLTGFEGMTPLSLGLDKPMVTPGLPAEIAVPLRAFRNYDVLVDFPGRKFTIGPSGSIHFQGSSAKVQIDPNDGSIQVPSQIEKKKYNLDLDFGTSISFLSSELFNTLATAHADWPHMVGAVGPASSSGLFDELTARVMRVDHLQFGPLFLTNVAVAGKDKMQFLGKLASAGSLGSEALLNYRVGIDYAHSTVYFDIGRTATLPDFDVVGLILQVQDDGSYKILGVADLDGKPSVPTGADAVQPGDELIAVNDNPVHGATLGAVWSLLGGTPGQERRLTIERASKQFTVVAKIQHFLAEADDANDGSKKPKR
jgi:hypothetical protein